MMKVWGKVLAVGLLGIATLFSATAPAKAGIIPWLYDAIFGPVRAPYYGGAYYGAYYAPPIVPAPCGPAGCALPPAVSVAPAPCPVPACPPQIAFAPPPVVFGPCGPICPSPCDAGCPTGIGCPTGGCPIPSQAGAPQSSGAAPATEPKTFAEESKPVPEPKQEGIDEGFRPREKGSPNAGAVPTEAFKPTETVIPKKKPAPAQPPEESKAAETPRSENDKPAKDQPARPETSSEKKPAEEPEFQKPVAPTKTNSGSAKPAENRTAPAGAEKRSDQKKSDARRLPVPTLKLDEKVTWYVVPMRRRLPLRARFATPVVARSRIDRNAGWTTIPAGAELVQK